MRDQIRKLAVGGNQNASADDGPSTLYTVSDSEDESVGSKLEDRQVRHSAWVYGECMGRAGTGGARLDPNPSQLTPLPRRPLSSPLRPLSERDWDIKPPELSRAICEALKRNVVFRGISESLLLEVR